MDIGMWVIGIRDETAWVRWFVCWVCDTYRYCPRSRKVRHRARLNKLPSGEEIWMYDVSNQDRERNGIGVVVRSSAL